MAIRLLLACFLMSAIAMPASAQSFSQNIERVSELNKINPVRNPKYKRSDKVLSRHVLDRKNKVIGQIEDIIIRENGNIQMLNVKLDRMRLGSLSLNYSHMGIRTASNAYTLPIDDKQVKSLYPTLLAEMETAAGSDEEIFSVRKIIGAPVNAQDGRIIGNVKDVLFNNSATRVEALYITLKIGIVRGSHVAIPFRGSLIIKDTGYRKEIVVDNIMADVMISYAKGDKHSSFN